MVGTPLTHMGFVVYIKCMCIDNLMSTFWGSLGPAAGLAGAPLNHATSSNPLFLQVLILLLLCCLT